MSTTTKTFAPSTLMKLSIADLKSQASKMKITFEATATKQQLTDLIIAKQSANQDPKNCTIAKVGNQKVGIINAKKAAMMDMGNDDMDIALAGGKKTLTVSVEKGTEVLVREKAKDQKPKPSTKTIENNEPSKLNKVGTVFSFIGKAKDHHHKVVSISKDGKAECESLKTGKKWTTKFPLTNAKYSTKVIIHKVGK